MKKRLTLPIGLLFASSVSTLACDGSVRCAIRNAPRQVVENFPGFLSNHAGLLIGAAIAAVVVGFRGFTGSEVRIDKR
jgi:hypothetical protein